MEELGRRSSWWWWLVVVAGLAVVVLVVLQPWADHPTEPAATDVPAAASDIPVGPSPSLTRTGPSAAGSTPAPVPGEDAVFDAATLPTLFVTPQDLAVSVPAAKGGVRAGVGPGTVAWGLPAGASIDPATCTTAVTVVARPPDEFDARSSLNDAFTWQQRVAVLADADAARDAFRDLVTTVDACPAYAQTKPDAPQVAWAAEPAIEGQGVYPSIVQELTRSEGTTRLPSFHGHMLVGNTIVTWTATALAEGTDTEAALATLGDATTLNAMVQGRARLAVEALG
ncbi:sensor domain-containing protein [Cellulomonas edaphi]|uniref:Sensor domain-containing protein n=1 Tax=Cellulomonas edaphi TaxID=3053468 RepID=A0ABT7S9Y2_9CELL|nr:sensor domain-containing protein [Cellulomons edaphi]MDM7832422.1 sensor domain-containing protein [Cellulomons edaphi]